jgi:hypothetical protein
MKVPFTSALTDRLTKLVKQSLGIGLAYMVVRVLYLKARGVKADEIAGDKDVHHAFSDVLRDAVTDDEPIGAVSDGTKSRDKAKAEEAKTSIRVEN